MPQWATTMSHHHHTLQNIFCVLSLLTCILSVHLAPPSPNAPSILQSCHFGWLSSSFCRDRIRGWLGYFCWGGTLHHIPPGPAILWPWCECWKSGGSGVDGQIAGVHCRQDCVGDWIDRDAYEGNQPAQIRGTEAEPQQIVAQRLLSCLQYHVP